MIPCITALTGASTRRPASFGTLIVLGAGQGERVDWRSLPDAAPRPASLAGRCLCCLRLRRAGDEAEAARASALGAQRAILRGLRSRLEEEWGRTGLEQVVEALSGRSAVDLRPLLEPESAGPLGAGGLAKLIESGARVLHERCLAAQQLAWAAESAVVPIPAQDIEAHAWGFINNRMNRAVAQGELPAACLQSQHGLTELRPEIRAAVLRAFRDEVRAVTAHRTRVDPRTLAGAAARSLHAVLAAPPSHAGSEADRKHAWMASGN